MLAVVVVVPVAAGLAVFASVAGQRLLTPDETPATAVRDPDTPPGLTEFRSPEAGFAVSYPAGWQRLQVADPQVALVAARDQQVSLLVRVAELDVAVGLQELPAARQLTDQIVMANESVELLAEPQPIELAGLPGYFYFYSFQDPGTGQRGVHSHFFVFNGQTLFTLVFQALPTEQFPAAAPTFDQITASFRILEK
ncbi:MAG: photosystem II reaction center PsbP family protein [Actinomycetota bacterium]|nr:photosystem II reaction center PsbP family protein [Actinomycetota bacterium]